MNADFSESCCSSVPDYIARLAKGLRCVAAHFPEPERVIQFSFLCDKVALAERAGASVTVLKPRQVTPRESGAIRCVCGRR